MLTNKTNFMLKISLLDDLLKQVRISYLIVLMACLHGEKLSLVGGYPME